MEEILIVALQLLFEIVVQLLMYGGLDLAYWSSGKEEKSGGAGCLVMLIFFFLGAGVGGLVTWVHPGVFLAYPWLRIANLIAGPIVAGGVSWWVADLRRRYGGTLLPNLHFWLAFWFVLGFNVVRFVYATH